MQSTFETKLELTSAEQELLEAQARQLSDAEYKIFVRLYVEKADSNEVKRWALEEFKITARQYNAIVYDLKGRVAAQAEHQKRHVETLAGQIKATKTKIVELEKQLKNPSAQEKKLSIEQQQKRRAKTRFTLHQKKRRLAQLEAKLKQIETALKTTGGVALFHRFVARKQKDGSIAWYLKTSVEEQAAQITTDPSIGASYGLSVDGSAAIAIGRRALRMSERPVHRSKSPSLDKIVIEAKEAHGKGKHVWSLWNGERKRLGPDRRSWPGRRPEKGIDGCDQKLSFERPQISSDRTSITGAIPVAS